MATQISFFEEFPDSATFEKAALIDFDTKIYLAAKSLPEFETYETWLKVANPHVTDVVYWPVLEKDEGYWISSWAEPSALERVLGEVEQRKDRKPLDVMLDLEPSLKRSRLFSFKDFRRNKDYVSDFVRNAGSNNISIYTVEKSYIPEFILEPLGLSYNPAEYGNKQMKMFYSSFRRAVLPDFIVNKLFERKARQYKKRNTIMGLGCIIGGVHETEPVNSPGILKYEVETAKAIGLEEVVIFRLNGLSDEYLKAISKSL
ncbi:MAG: hypothetical protein V1734_03755 [Nanoarchaeota archaeon]